MENIPRRRPLVQLTLFYEQAPLPHWHELDQTIRIEVARLLAKLLIEKFARVAGHRNGGHVDE